MEIRRLHVLRSSVLTIAWASCWCCCVSMLVALCCQQAFSNVGNQGTTARTDHRVPFNGKRGEISTGLSVCHCSHSLGGRWRVKRCEDGVVAGARPLTIQARNARGVQHDSRPCGCLACPCSDAGLEERVHASRCLLSLLGPTWQVAADLNIREAAHLAAA